MKKLLKVLGCLTVFGIAMLKIYDRISRKQDLDYLKKMAEEEEA